MSKLKSDVALVTGGASGLGKAIAHRLLSEGARVIVTDLQRDLGEATAAEGGFEFFQHDVCEENRWLEVVREVERRHGGLNILVNNAGVLGPPENVDPESTQLSEWRRIFAVNVEGVFLGCKSVIPAMRRAGRGSIVNMSSIGALIATPFATAYGASKAAVRQLTKSVAQYCMEEKLNVRCNSVHPGVVSTPLWLRQAEGVASKRGISIEEVIAETRAIIPMGDLTLADDVAAAVCFLASEDARHITGSKMIVDGGMINCDSYRRSTAVGFKGRPER